MKSETPEMKSDTPEDNQKTILKISPIILMIIIFLEILVIALMRSCKN